MDEAKLGISDLNSGQIEGTVVGNPNMQETTDGRKTLNFAIEIEKIGSTGKKYYKHQVVAFGKIAEVYEPYIKNGVFVRIKYHLIQQSLVVGDKNVEFSKISCDYIEIAE